MGKFGKRMAKFANSPKGQKLRDKAMRKAKDPKTRAKLEKKFGKKVSGRQMHGAAQPCVGIARARSSTGASSGVHVRCRDLTELVERAAAASRPRSRRSGSRADVDAVRRKDAEARAFAEEAARTASTVPQAAGASARKPSG